MMRTKRTKAQTKDFRVKTIEVTRVLRALMNPQVFHAHPSHALKITPTKTPGSSHVLPVEVLAGHEKGKNCFSLQLERSYVHVSLISEVRPNQRGGVHCFANLSRT